MEQKLNQLKELRARTEQRRTLWNDSVKDKIIDDMEAINKQFNMSFIPSIEEHPNCELLSFNLPEIHLGIIYNGSLVKQSSAAIIFYQLVNGKIAVAIQNSKIEALEIKMRDDFTQLGIFEPEDIYKADKSGFVESLLTHLIDFDNHQETMITESL